jgi:hypothetical protein
MTPGLKIIKRATGDKSDDDERLDHDENEPDHVDPPPLAGQRL